MIGAVILLTSMAHAGWADEPTLDVVPFGQVCSWDESARDYGVFWEERRDIFRVVVRFAGHRDEPDPKTLHLEYWQSWWPEKRIPRDKPAGAGEEGWLHVGDWFQGKWMKADTDLQADGAVYSFTFHPVNAREFPELTNFAATYRTTFKIRLVGETALPRIAAFEAYTDSTLQPFDFEIEWGGSAQDKQVWDGRLEVFNGRLEHAERQEGTDRLHARVLFARTAAYNSFDETIVTVRARQHSFSFAASDLAKWGHILIPDFGVLVRKAGETLSYAEAEARRNALPVSEQDLYSRVKDVPEQTFPRAWADMPAKGRHYIPLSFEGSRQHFGLDERGNVFCLKNWIEHLPGKDTAQCLWDGHEIRYRFGLPDTDPETRTLMDGCLPTVVSEWTADGVRYRQTAFAYPLDGVPRDATSVAADDTMVLMLRFELERIASGTAMGRLIFGCRHGDKEEDLVYKEGLVAASTSDPERVRIVVLGKEGSLQKSSPNTTFEAMFDDRSALARLDMAIPFVTLTSPADWSRVRALNFDRALERVAEHWRGRVEASAMIRTPEPMINDFYRAHMSHLLINTEREVNAAGRYIAKVGTFHYGAFANESCMMVSDLDRRGFHKRAEETLETWLHYQGTVPLPGDYSSHDGVFYGAGGYEHGEYNQHHGWVLWCLGEHYWYTRDKAWLNRAAPHIVSGCEWIVEQRERTVEEAGRTPIRAIERGLLPPGTLEDIRDWRCWLSTNIYSWWGMQNAAAALADAGHPDGRRLLDEAEAYRKDLLAAFTEAMARAPVVRLRDGAWVPHVPSEVHRRGRSFGWITETLEGGIHLIRCGVIEPWDPLATWIIQDYEDNLYLSQQYGYELTGPDFDRYWFGRGGISMQANLLCNPIPYLQRDEPKHFLRAYFNAFAASYFPDTRMMTEHALPNLGDWRGDHYKSSDEANSTYWLRLMFVQERGDELWLGAAIPRYWLAEGQSIGIERAATFFGPMSLRYESHVKNGQITAFLDPPTRNPPRVIYVRFRHPDGKRFSHCNVNDKPFDRVDSDEDWVEITDAIAPLQIRALYD
ncbi:MAG: hypothetical protein HY706_02505 [Candidatus Hydrogenedentes bacterium]|nr:hypothetical protein [Candidatus Hydrogenedentota bacterium]